MKNASFRAGGLSRPLPQPLPSNFSPPFEFVEHVARNRIRLIEFSAFSQGRQLRRLASLKLDRSSRSGACREQKSIPLDSIYPRKTVNSPS